MTSKIQPIITRLLIALITGLAIHFSPFFEAHCQSENYDPIYMVNRALGSYQIVAIGESQHESPEIYSFYKNLLNNHEFVKSINTIVFETANAAHQELLDKYIYGEDISIAKLSVVWRDTTNSGEQTGDSPLYLVFFKLIRQVNKTLPQVQKIRILAGDPPIDWSKVKSKEDLSAFLSDRDRHYGELVIREVIEKKKKALLIMGSAHFYRNYYSNDNSNDFNIIKMIQEKSPNSLYVINMIDNPKIDNYQYPSILPTSIPEIGNLPVSDLNPTAKLANEIDAVLYLGPLTKTNPLPFEQSSPYYEEYLRRKKIAEINPFEIQTAPQKDIKFYKTEIKKILFDIADMALQDYNIRLTINKDAKYCDFQIPESFQNQKEGFYFQKVINNSSKDQFILIGQWIKDWNSKTPKLQIKVATSKFNDFAIVEIKEF